MPLRRYMISPPDIFFFAAHYFSPLLSPPPCRHAFCLPSMMLPPYFRCAII